MTSPTAVSDGPPLDPSSPEARQWVQDELARRHYTTEPSPLQRFLDWLWGHLSGGTGGGLLPPWVVGLVVLAVLAVIALLIALRLRAEPAAGVGRARRAVVDDAGLTAADYRARAASARGRDDWDAVLLDSYRALAAAAVERTLLTDLPGRTAHEVSVALESAFPDHAAALATGAGEFDAVRYGHRHTTRARATAVADLDATLQSTRPVLDHLVTS